MISGRSPAGAWRVASPVIARLAGVPVAALAGMRLAATTRELDELAAQETRLAERGRALAAELFPVIGACAPPGPRAELVALRRALHTGVPPRTYAWHDRTPAALPTELAGNVAAWCTDRAATTRRAGHAEAAFADELAGARAALRAGLATAELRRALCSAAPTLLADIETWLRDPQRAPKRQKLLRAAKFLARAATKTSPYSTLNSLGACTWQESGPVARFALDAGQHCVLEAPNGFLPAIRAALLDRPELRAAIRLRLNPAATPTGDAVYTLAGESLVHIGLTDGLRQLIRHLQDSPEWTVAGLRALLGGEDAALRRLVDAGILQPYLPVDQDAADAIGALACWARDAPPLASALGDVAAALGSRIAVSDVDTHRQRQHELHRAMRTLAERLNLDPGLLPAPPAVAHETAVRPGPVAVLATPHWRPALADLDVVRRFFGLFDLDLPTRLALGHWAGERYGAGARLPLTELYRDVQRELANPASPAGHALSGLLRLSPGARPAAEDPRTGELRALRRRARELLSRPAGPDGIHRIDPAELAGFIATWPAWLVPPGSMACYVQASTASGALELVWNTGHGGYGRGRTRLRHLLALAGETPAAVREEHPHDGLLLAELAGESALSLNAHAPQFHHRIDLPGPHRAGTIPAADLFAAHRPDTGLLELHSHRHQARVAPVHLGMASPFLLPPFAQFLIRAFGAGYQPSTLPVTAEPHRITRSPRIQAGRVILQRARWIVPARCVPRRAGTDLAHLAALRSWLRTEEIPERCFIRALPTDATGHRAKAHKPLFVDFADHFLVQCFDRLRNDTDALLIEEPLPDPRTDTLGSGRATEFLIELTTEPETTPQ